MNYHGLDMHTNADSHEEVRRLFQAHVPEVASGAVEIMGIARAPGTRIIVTVRSKDERVDPVGVCIGERGARIKTILRNLSGEKIDVVRWSDSLKPLLVNLLYPALIDDILVHETARRVVIFCDFDNKKLMTGVNGLKIKMVSELVGWELQVETG